MDGAAMDALAEEVSELAVRLMAEPQRVRWTGEVIPLTAKRRVIGARARLVGLGEGDRWALFAVDGAASSRLAEYAERGSLRWLRVEGARTGGDHRAGLEDAGGVGDARGQAQAALCVGVVDVDGLVRVHAEDRLGAWAESCPELAAITEVYGVRQARRSGVRLIRHIYEGIAVLRALGASELAIRGFCVHPLVQSDRDFAGAWAQGRLAGLDPQAVALAVEYRAVANAFLSSMENHPGYADPAAIRRSPLVEVDAMLVADKIQNAKDFERFHRDSHPRAEWLGRYFDRWLEALDVSSEKKARLTAEISLPQLRWSDPESVEDSS